MRDWLEHVAPLQSVLARHGFDRDDPRSSLAQSPLKLEHSRPYRLLLATPILAGAAAGITGAPWPVFVLVIVAATIAMPLYYLRPSWRIEIRLDSVRCAQAAAVVKLPWRVLDQTGTPLIDSWDRRMVLPIKPDAVAELELWRDGLRCSQGSLVQTRQAKVLDAAKVAIKGAYGIDPDELASFVLWLASILAPDAGSDPSERMATGESPELSLSEHGKGSPRWMTLDLSRLELPAACCGCGQTGFEWRQIEAVNLWLFALTATQYRSSIYMSVPVCNRCWRLHKKWKWALAGIAGIVGGVAALLMALTGGVTNVIVVLLIIASGFVVFGLFGFAIGESTRRPAKIASYSKRKSTVRVFFRNDSYRESASALQRAGVE